MKQKLLATIAVSLVIFSGVISPMFGLFGKTFETQHASAQSPATGSPAVNTTAINNQQSQLDCGTNFLCGGVSLLSEMFLFVPQALTAVGGMILDYSIWSTIQSKPYTDQDQPTSFVVQGWKLVRDFSNLLFLFALFAIAFSLILGINVGGLDPKRTIITVIIMALLVNFSFFLCRVAIDVTNIFGGVFYDKITSPTASQANNVNAATANGGSTTTLGSTQTFYNNSSLSGMKSISLSILNQVNPQALVLGNTGAQSSGGWWTFGWKSYDLSVYGLILLMTFITFFFDLFLLYIFVTSSVFLIGRTIGLFFFIILSPIAFVSVIIPTFKAKAYFGFDDWITQFSGLALTAPIYLFFLYLAVIFLKAPLLTPTNNPGFLTTAAVITIKLAVVGMVLLFGKKITKDLSGKVGAMTSDVITGTIKAAAVAGGAFATGGLAGVGELAMSKAKEKGLAVAKDVGEKTIGKERVEELQKRMGVLKNFNKNPQAAFRAAAKIATAGPETYFVGDVAKSFKFGEFANRRKDMDAAAKAKEKDVKARTSAINYEIARLQKKKAAEPWNSDEIDKDLKEQNDALANIKDPTFTARKIVGKARKQLKDNEKAIKDIDDKLKVETDDNKITKLFKERATAVNKRDREKATLDKNVEDGEKEIQKNGALAEIADRERTPKMDTKNREANADAITKLKAKVAGLTPPPPTTPVTTPPPPPPTTPTNPYNGPGPF